MTVTESLENNNIQTMYKTKHIAKDVHFNRKGQSGRETNRHHDDKESLPFLEDLPGMGIYDQSYLLTDFLQNFQMEQPPYYLDHCLDPYFDPYYDSDHSDPPTAPVRLRICIQRINHQYLQRMGQLAKGPKQATIKFNNEIKIKYFGEDDAPQCIGAYQQYIEVVEEQKGIEEQVSQ